MNLVCFPSFCAGAIVCDLLNCEKSNESTRGGIDNFNSSKLKISNNRNNSPGWKKFFFEKNLKSLNLNDNNWIGTHNWPTEVDTTVFDKVLIITTENKMSRIYRLMRAFFLYKGFKKLHNSTNENIDENLAKLDLSRFKFNFDKYHSNNTINIEFEEIVEWSENFSNFVKQNSINYSQEHFDERKEYWKNSNKFLYDNSLIDKFVNRYNDYEKM